jgi:hypothetical protein
MEAGGRGQPAALMHEHCVRLGADTWDELLQLVSSVNGTDLNGDGVGDWAACMW